MKLIFGRLEEKNRKTRLWMKIITPKLYNNKYVQSKAFSSMGYKTKKK